MPDTRAGGVAVGVVMQVVAAHGLVVSVVEDDGQEGQVGFAGNPEALGNRVVEEAAVTHQGNHRPVGHCQLDAQGQTESLAQAAVGVEVALRPVPLDVAHNLPPVGGHFLGVNGVVGHGLADGGAEPDGVNGPLGAGRFFRGLPGGSQAVVFGGPLLAAFVNLGSVGAGSGAARLQGFG